MISPAGLSDITSPEAHQYSRLEGGSVRCSLCSHRCTIREGKTGICGVRKNTEGILLATTFSRVSAEAIDPIEKKPLYHFHPGTLSYSLGSVGCNFHCTHCQNWHISQAEADATRLQVIPPEEGVRRAIAGRCASIAFTYNEPTIWHEYPLAMGAHAKERGIATIYVTNGYITEEALRELAPVLDAFRVDLKAFNEEFYRAICGAHLQPVLDATTVASELKMHIETVTLVIPGLNDDMGELEGLVRWVIENIGPDTPMHFTRFHPDYKMDDRPATPISLLEKIIEMARQQGLHYPYIGNVPGHRYDHTYCPACSALLIERQGYMTVRRALSGGACNQCGFPIPVVEDARR